MNVLATNFADMASGARPLVGDVSGDGVPEVLYLGVDQILNEFYPVAFLGQPGGLSASKFAPTPFYFGTSLPKDYFFPTGKLPVVELFKTGTKKGIVIAADGYVFPFELGVALPVDLDPSVFAIPGVVTSDGNLQDTFFFADQDQDGRDELFVFGGTAGDPSLSVHTYNSGAGVPSFSQTPTASFNRPAGTAR